MVCSDLLRAEHPERTSLFCSERSTPSRSAWTSPSRSEWVVPKWSTLGGPASPTAAVCWQVFLTRSTTLFYFGGTWMFCPAEGLVVTSLTTKLVNVGINRWALIMFITKCSRCWSASTLFAFSFSSRCNFYFFYLNVFLVTKVSFQSGGKTLSMVILIFIKTLWTLFLQHWVVHYWGAALNRCFDVPRLKMIHVE